MSGSIDFTFLISTSISLIDFTRAGPRRELISELLTSDSLCCSVVHSSFPSPSHVFLSTLLVWGVNAPIALGDCSVVVWFGSRPVRSPVGTGPFLHEKIRQELRATIFPAGKSGGFQGKILPPNLSVASRI